MKLPSWIYRSERIGKNGKPFSLYKFRTMIPNADKVTQFATPEVYTRYGKFLRKTKLDELPQLINVFKGDLNLVGPRPDFIETWEIVPDHVRKKVLSVKPGLTSLASIYFHDEEQLLQGQEDKYKNYWTIIKPMKLHLDLFYVAYKDLFLDLWILWKTVLIVLKSFFK